jgi:hypothetical protein
VRKIIPQDRQKDHQMTDQLDRANQLAASALTQFEAYVGDNVTDPEHRKRIIGLASAWVNREIAVAELRSSVDL